MLQLIFDGQQLEDEKLVFDYNVQRESTVDLQLPFNLHAPFPNWITESINITILSLTGMRFVIRVKGTDTIDDIKLCIQKAIDLPSGEHSKPSSEQIYDKFTIL